MSSGLSPGLALAYLGALSTDIRASAVASRDGRRLAGDPALAAQARGLVAGVPDGRPVRARQDGGETVMALADARHVVAVRVGPFALEGVMALDLRNVLADLA